MRFVDLGDHVGMERYITLADSPSQKTDPRHERLGKWWIFPMWETGAET